jgi:PadR family transcriptional regulator, regulatory protein PadR
MSDSYLSYAATVILQAAANGYRYGFDIMDATGLPSGTVYPALRRMEAASLIVSKWEPPAVAQREQRPARKYYELTRSGQQALSEAASRYRLNERAAPRVGKPAPVRR